MAALASPIRHVALALALATAAASPTVAREGTATRGIGPSGLPLPRFASLASGR